MSTEGALRIAAFLVLSTTTFAEAVAATPTDPSIPVDLTETDACQSGLQFGITPDKIPLECHAHRVAVKAGDEEDREKWGYSQGFLIFSHGVLKAIRQIKN